MFLPNFGQVCFACLCNFKDLKLLLSFKYLTFYDFSVLFVLLDCAIFQLCLLLENLTFYDF